MKTITVGQLRQNPTTMLNEVESGETYAITRHNREIARVVPRTPTMTLIPPKSGTPTRLADLPYHKLQTAESIDELLASERDR